jgi:photosystem II stability/assembly factor-like uncharacterized protein
MFSTTRCGGFAALAASLLALAAPARQAADRPEVAPPPRPVPTALTTEVLRGLPLRGIGPCITPGRVGDIAVNPKNPSVWYVAIASGGLWKTTNRGITWQPIFDDYGSYSVGCVTIDPKNPDTVWVGTGENQSQRSVGFGDGVYKSTNGGKTWSNVGLRNSEHIAKILIDPRYSDVVYVAAQGPLWAPGGDRGLYKTTDGGKTWKPVLTVSENTGVTDVCLDPRDPDVLYASTYQRRRHVGFLLSGGPEAGVYKSTDAGKTWERLSGGLPEGPSGRIALAVSPQKPDVVYAAYQVSGREGAFYRSEDGGKTWAKRSAPQVQDAQYYGELVPCPHKFDRVYMMDMTVQMTEDGGKTFRPQAWRGVHVDHHALWIDPDDPEHMLSGNDGGLYETFDAGRAWRHFATLNTTQFYRVAVDNALPFYNVYGGAQDNGSMGGPSRTRNRVGIRTSDWGVVGGADGMQPRVDPENPDIVYTSSQNGALVRLDRKTGVGTSIRPGAGAGFGKGKGKEKDQEKGKEKDQEKGKEKGKGKETVRWFWDSPLIISPHAPARLYYAGNRLFRSDDRGANWKPVSPDLTRRLDPNRHPAAEKLWSPGDIPRNTFTSPLSVIVALSESPVKEGLIYVGTDDGLVQVTEDGGGNWRKVEEFPGVPEGAYVSDVFASNHDDRTVYAAFNHYQYGDFKPYLLKSTDRGRTWESVAGNLPDRHPVWCVVEDHVNPQLLFAGTEFALFVTTDGGANWAKVSGAPTVQFRDLEIQKREGDLVCATFGRGFFILDDYGPLRALTPAALRQEGGLLPVRKTRAFAELPFARAGEEFAAPNPPPGALLTYYLRDPVRGANARVTVRIADAAGKVVREFNGPTSAGVHRVNWDLRAGGGGGGGGQGGGFGPRGGGGPLVAPGKYTATLVKVVDTDPIPLGEPQTFEVVPLDAGIPAEQP